MHDVGLHGLDRAVFAPARVRIAAQRPGATKVSTRPMQPFKLAVVVASIVGMNCLGQLQVGQRPGKMGERSDTRTRSKRANWMQNCAGSPGTNCCSSFNRAEPFGQRHEAELRQKRRSMTETAAFSIMCQRQPQQRLRRHACDFLFSPPPPEGAPSPEKLHLNALQLQQEERRKKRMGKKKKLS